VVAVGDHVPVRRLAADEPLARREHPVGQRVRSFLGLGPARRRRTGGQGDVADGRPGRRVAGEDEPGLHLRRRGREQDDRTVAPGGGRDPLRPPAGTAAPPHVDGGGCVRRYLARHRDRDLVGRHREPPGGKGQQARRLGRSLRGRAFRDGDERGARVDAGNAVGEHDAGGLPLPEVRGPGQGRRVRPCRRRGAEREGARDAEQRGRGSPPHAVVPRCWCDRCVSPGRRPKRCVFVNQRRVTGPKGCSARSAGPGV
jgi:hypothetical protein